ERGRAARFDHQLELTKGEGDRGGDLLVAHGGAGADQRAVDGEGHFAGRLRHQCVADRAGERSVLFPPPALERTGMIVEALGLRAFTASAIPAVNPPPDAVTAMMSGTSPSAARSSTISQPVVPCPAMISASSYGGTSAAWRLSAISCAMAWRSSRARS